MSHALLRVGQATSRFGNWLLRLPMWQFVAIVGLLAATKSTFLWTGSFFYQESAAFPDPVTHFSTNFVAIGIHRAAGVYVSPIFLASSLLALAAAVTALIWFLWRANPSPEARRTAIVLAFAWPAVLVVLPWIGNGTAFLPLFMVLALVAKRVWIWVPALLLAIASHPEHAFVGLTLLSVLSLRPEFITWRNRALVGFLIAGSAVLATSLWLASAGVSGRGNEFTSGVGFALPFAFRNGVLGAYTWWGMWWLIVLVVLVLVSTRTRWVLLLVAVVLPAVMTAFTADYTRVFVGVTIPVGIAMIFYLLAREDHRQEPHSSNGQPPGFALGFWFIAFVLLPNLIFMMPGDGVPTPGFYWVGLFENYVLPRI